MRYGVQWLVIWLWSCTISGSGAVWNRSLRRTNIPKMTTQLYIFNLIVFVLWSSPLLFYSTLPALTSFQTQHAAVFLPQIILLRTETFQHGRSPLVMIQLLDNFTWLTENLLRHADRRSDWLSLGIFHDLLSHIFNPVELLTYYLLDTYILNISRRFTFWEPLRPFTSMFMVSFLLFVCYPALHVYFIPFVWVLISKLRTRRITNLSSMPPSWLSSFEK